MSAIRRFLNKFISKTTSSKPSAQSAQARQAREATQPTQPTQPAQPVSPIKSESMQVLNQQPAVDEDTTNIVFNIISMFPIFITLMLLLISLINTSIFSSFISYFVGLLILTVLWKVISGLLPDNKLDKTSKLDKTIQCAKLTLLKNVSPLDYGLGYLIFTFLYIFIPMIIYQVFNIGLIIFLSTVTILDVVIKKKYNCYTNRTIFMSCLLGFVWSCVYIMIIYNMFSTDEGSAEAAFFISNLDSNKASCSRPKEQQFKCAVYKNGELLKTI